MRYRKLGRTGFNVSEIGLGTVELGIDYGIRTDQSTNQPSEKDAHKLLNYAIDLGVNFIDTASAYGISEEIIGRALHTRREEFFLATKSLHWLDEGVPPAKAKGRIEASIHKSLKNLQTDVIDLIQIHGRDIPSLEKEMIEAGDVYDVLDRAREAGKVKYIGYSSYAEDASIAIIKHGGWDTLQLAYSIFDQRNSIKVMPLAKAHDIGLIIRSALLKGALTPKSSHLPKNLEQLKKKTDALNTFLTENITTIPQLALRFVLSNAETSTIIVGADKIPYLEEAAGVSDGHLLPDDVMDTLRTMAIKNPDLINPGTWGIP